MNRRDTYNCVWNGKSRLSKHVVVQEYTEEGLSMIDLSSFVCSLKCSWIHGNAAGNGKWINSVNTIIDFNKLYN